MKYTLLIFTYFYLSFSAFASSVKFHSINSLYGISIRATNSICKDENGFIWASSKIGILRLTDDDHRIYQLPYETTGAIIVKLSYENSKLFAYSNNGQIFFYNEIYDRFDLVINLCESIPIGNFDMYKLLIDKADNFWIAINTGLYKYNSGKLTLVDDVSEDKYAIAWFDNQHIIISSSQGVELLDIESMKSRKVCDTKKFSPFSVSSIFMDKNQNKLWMGTLSNGLFCYDFVTDSISHLLESSIPKQPILAIEENSDSTLLVGVDGQGIWELHKTDKQLLNVYKENVDDINSLRGNGIYDIFYEKDKRVWISTISGGLSFYDLASPIVTQVFHYSSRPNSLVNNDVNGILEDSDGRIWFATNNGISCWDISADIWKNYYNNKREQTQVFLTLCEDDFGRIWAGSYSSGFYVLDKNTGRELAHYCRNDKLFPSISNFIFDIFKDSQGDLWIGGINGDFMCYLSKEDRFETFSEEPISSFAEYSPGKIILGFSYGLSMLDKSTGELDNLLSGIVVQDILVLGEKIWICTSGEGLVEYDCETGTIEKFTTQSGLPSNFINSIVYSDNYLWVGTENGLCRFNPENKTARTFQSIFPLSGISYNKSSVYKLQNGEMVWGTNQGAVFFASESLYEIESNGRIFFQDLSISGRTVKDNPLYQLTMPVDSLESLNLRYFQNTISIEMIPIGAAPGAKFSWKLEGFDNEWSSASNNRIVTYTNLPSGKFNLKVKLLDNSTTQELSERSLAIRLIPPFWRKSWFLGLLLSIGLGIIFLYLLYYINSLKQKHTQEKVRFFTNTAHDIRTSLTLIKAPVEELNKEINLSGTGRYNLELALDQTRKLSSVVTQLMDFQKVDIGKGQLVLSKSNVVKLLSDRISMFKSVADGKNIELELTTNQKRYFTAIDESKMEKVIDNLISNAIKYANPDTKIQLDFKTESDKWIFKVKDKGIGINKQAQHQLFKEFFRGENAVNSKIVGSGIGLLLVQKYVSLHNGNVSFESEENVGSTFQIEIPFKELLKENTDVNLNPESENILEKGSPATVDKQKEASPKVKHTKEMKILVVEDNEDLLSFMQNTLENNFKVFTAQDGLIAWNFIRKQMPDLIVSDVMMPNKDGFELCRLMKSTYETSHIPIILLTALSEKTDELRGLGLGADDYLTKPFDMNLLVQRIKTIIQNREVVRDKALKLIKNENSEPLFENEHNDKFVKRMLEVAKLNFSNSEFDKNEFAKAMNVSSSLLYKKMKSLTNLSPTDFIKTFRLNHAFKLVSEKKYSITEISELCGFTSVGYFSTVFKKHFKKSPSEILK